MYTFYITKLSRVNLLRFLPGGHKYELFRVVQNKYSRKTRNYSTSQNSSIILSVIIIPLLLMLCAFFPEHVIQIGLSIPQGLYSPPPSPLILIHLIICLILLNFYSHKHSCIYCAIGLYIFSLYFGHIQREVKKSQILKIKSKYRNISQRKMIFFFI